MEWARNRLTLFAATICSALFLHSCCPSTGNSDDPEYESLIILKSLDTSYHIIQVRIDGREPNWHRGGYPVSAIAMPLNVANPLLICSASGGRTDTILFSNAFDLQFTEETSCKNSQVVYTIREHRITRSSFDSVYLDVRASRTESFIFDTLFFRP